MVAVAHQAERRIVTPEVVGSRPIGHPILFPRSPTLANLPQWVVLNADHPRTHDMSSCLWLVRKVLSALETEYTARPAVHSTAYFAPIAQLDRATAF